MQYPPNPWRQAGVKTAFISGAFCLLVALLLALNYFQSAAYDPLGSPELTELKAALSRRSGDEQLKKRIRALDLQLRQELARRQALGAQGAWLLVGGMAVFLFSIKSVTYRKKLPRPPKRYGAPGEQARATAKARWAVTLAGVVLGGSALVWALRSESIITSQLLKLASSPETESAEPPPPTTPFPTPEEIKQNWPRFRGPGGLGISVYTNVPLTWNVQTGAGMLWKAAVPIFNPNSPIVWGNRVFLTGATAGNREVYCFDALSGRLLWQKPVNTPEGSSGEPPTVSEESGSFAAATAATDGRRVYAIFATGDVAAFDFKGNLVWAINLGKPDNSYGHASSLEIYQDRLLVLFDQGTGKDGKSKLLALDTLSGKTVWQSQPRPIPNSWASPILVNTGQRNLIVTCGNPWAIAYDPATGTELWRAQVLYGEITPSPIYANGLVLTAMEGEKLSAIRPDGVGDVTKTHVVWTADEGLPDIPSPLSDDQRIYLATSGGAVTCYDAKTGKKLWDKELEVSFKSSPSLAGNRVYLVADNGLTFVLHAGPEFKELARSDLGEEVLASPAFADGRIYIRGKQHLFCLGNKGKTK